jgi:hypothetical protein
MTIIEWEEPKARSVLIGSAPAWIEIEVGSLRIGVERFTCREAAGRCCTIVGRVDQLRAVQHVNAEADSAVPEIH